MLKASIKVYLNCGQISEEELSFEESTTKEEAILFIEDLKKDFKLGFKNNTFGEFSFGETIFRFSDISAIKIFLL